MIVKFKAIFMLIHMTNILFVLQDKKILQKNTGCDNLFTGCSCKEQKIIQMKGRISMKERNNTKGITLIALVITIVLNCSCLAMERMLNKVNILKI